MLNSKSSIDIIDQMKVEVNKQNNKWGLQNHRPETWLAILTEEVGEVSSAILKGEKDEYRRELIQTMAVCFSAIYALDHFQQKTGGKDEITTK